MKHRLLWSLPFLSVATAILAVGEPAASVDSKAAFERLKTLAGEWQADTSMGKARLTYEVIAGGSAVVEREMMDDHQPMMTIYHLDGSRLMLTHYCMAGNQPRMTAGSFDPATGAIRWDFLDITNLVKPEAGYMHNAVMRIPGGDRFSASWDYWVGGKLSNTEKFEYTRVK